MTPDNTARRERIAAMWFAARAMGDDVGVTLEDDARNAIEAADAFIEVFDETVSKESLKTPAASPSLLEAAKAVTLWREQNAEGITLSAVIERLRAAVAREEVARG